jgi:endoglucanase
VTSSVPEKTSAATAQSSILEVGSSVPAPEPLVTTETQLLTSEMTLEKSTTMAVASSQEQTVALSTTLSQLTPTTTDSTTTSTTTTTTSTTTTVNNILKFNGSINNYSFDFSLLASTRAIPLNQ